MLADQKQGAFNVDNTKELKHISLCAGYGGIDLGLSRTLGSIRTVCFVEIESFAIKNLVSKIEKGLLSTAPIFTDLKKFPWRLFNGKVDILSGGFPCQPFSNAGRKQGDQDPRHLWPYITKGIEHLGRPSIVFFENVSGIISSKLKGNDWTDQEGTPVLLHVLRELERLGYKATAGTFSAAEVGAPHQRKRVFILGIRNELKQSAIDFINGLIKSNESNKSTAWPATRGLKQNFYEPPRVTLGHSNHKRLERCGIEKRSKTEKRWGKETRLNTSTSITPRKLQSKTQYKVDRDADGDSDWLDYAKLYESLDKTPDELRLLGNGVVPNTAARAFKVLGENLENSKCIRL